MRNATAASSLAAGAVAFLFLAGCSGGSAGPVRGRVVLPSGLSNPGGYTIATGFGSGVPVGGDGGFTVPATADGPLLVLLEDPAGKVVMASFVDAAEGGDAAQVSAPQTAVALLYLALGGFGLPPSDGPAVLDLLRQDPATATLSDALATAMAANPAAFTDGDPQVDSALSTALHQLAAETPSSSAGALVARALTGASVQPLLLIEPNPGTRQSGVNANDASEGSGVVLQNNFRRIGQFRVFKTGTQVQGQPPDMLTIVGDPIPGADGVALRPLESTQALKGAFGSVANVALGKVPFGPVSSEPVDLPLDDGTLKTFYQVVLIGPTLNASNLGPAMSDPLYAGLHADFQQTSVRLAAEQFVRQVLLPLLAQVILPNGKVQEFFANELPPEALAIVQGPLTEVFLDEVSDLADDLSKGDYGRAVTDIAAGFAEHPELRAGVVENLKEMLTTTSVVDLANFESADAVLEGLEKANAFLKAVNAAMTGFDVAVQLKDLAQSRMTEVWNVTAVKPSVHLEPQQAEVDLQTSVITFTAGVPGQPDPGRLRFLWTTTGAMGSLEDVSGVNDHPVTGQPVTDAAVDYVADLQQVRDGRVDTVAVQVFDQDDLLNEIGDAQAFVTAKLSTATCNSFPDPIVSGCGDVQVPFLATPGDTFAVGVTLHTGGLCGNGASLNLNGTPVDGATVDGVDAPDPTSVPIPGDPGGGSGTVSRTVVFRISGNAPDQCPGAIPNADPNLFIPTLTGPWVVLNQGSGGNFSGWTTIRPFVVQR